MARPVPSQLSEWELVERTREVAERWKQMYLREEALCAEQRLRVSDSANAVSAAREMRDTAIDARRAAQDETAAARHDKARWRARADAQSNAKVAPPPSEPSNRKTAEASSISPAPWEIDSRAHGWARGCWRRCPLCCR